MENDFVTYPRKDYKYFLYDPEGGMFYFKHVKDRDKAIRECIQSYHDNDGWGWHEDVEFITVGEVTGVATKVDVTLRPDPEEFDNEEDYQETLEELGFDGNDFQYSCRYEILPLGE